ncbi:MAG: complex I subunit 5 family protein [Proteobacteria bacterium]|nr:complex I subunit 5 family protein [Pseudomonadota bacterium]MBU1716718.1 complex I subunit 5 family protein [Pseudomonadota bacterium]
MINGDLTQSIYLLLLFLIAGTPLVLAGACCTTKGKMVSRFLPLAAVPALLASYFVPAEMVVEVPWFFMSGRMGLDGLGRLFLPVSAFIWLLAGLSGRKYLESDPHRARFSFFFLTAMAGNFGLILARDILGYYLFFALMSFAAFGLVIHKGTKEAHKAARIYLLFVMIGEIALFLALALIADKTNTLMMAKITDPALSPVTLFLLFTGFGIKIGVLPLHGWMAESYQATPVPAATALAGAMVNAGLLGWLRFIPLSEIVSPNGALLFMILGALAALYGIIVGLTEKRAGAILAYSSISQMGLMTVVFGLGLTGFEAGRQALLILMIYTTHHSLAKTSLFLGYGVMKSQPRDPSKWQLAGLYLPALALAGLPFTSGAVAKSAFKEFAISNGEPWLGLSGFFLPLTAIGTTVLVLHFIEVVQRNEGPTTGIKPVDRNSWWLSLLAVALTIWLWPAASIQASHTLEPIKIWQAIWPVITGGLLYLVWPMVATRKKNEKNDYFPEISSLTGNTTEFDWTGKLNRVAKWFQQNGKTRKIDWGKRDSAAKIDLRLRQTEKIMQRWTIVGLSYLLLGIALYFLLI